MAIDKIKNLDECKIYVKKRLEGLRRIFAQAAVGNFSENVPESKDDDEFSELYFGLQLMLEVIRKKISEYEKEIGERQEIEKRFIFRNRELSDSQKAMINILEDLQEAKTNIDQEEAKYEALLNSVGDGVMAVDSQGSVIFVNDAAEKLLGMTGEELLGNKMVDIVLEDADGNAMPVDKRPSTLAIKAGKTIHTSDYYYVKKGKARFAVSITVSPIFVGNRITGAIETFRDITKEKELDRAKSEFISIASHQLRTPVSALNWITESLRESLKGLTAKQKEYFDDFSISVNRLVKLVEDLLNVSRIELGTLKIDAKEVELNDFLKEFSDNMKSYADLKKHSLVFNPQVDEVRVKIDPRVLNDIVQNLASNAIDYSPAKSKVIIDLEKSDDCGKIFVANPGPAIPEEEQVNLFQKFYRGESGKKIKQEGTGLGLYIVKSLVENSGGKVGFSSAAGKGTVFWFTLPILKK
jgi:PAS domain S-box-containing protein